jgi:two-component system, LytTR family, response regulator
MRVGIADDERLARERLRRLVEAAGDAELVFQCGDGDAAVVLTEQHRPDVLFLDIRMPGGDGFDVVARLVERLGDDALPLVVFVTAWDEHAVRAFDSHAVDYLVKPFDDERFAETLRRLRRRVGHQRLHAAAAQLASLVRPSSPQGTPDTAAPASTGATSPAPLRSSSSAVPETDSGRLDRIVVKQGGRGRLIPATMVDWIEAESVHARLHIGSHSYLIRIPMHRLETRLDPQRFARIHRSTIVNLDRVRDLYAADNMLVLHDGTALVISRSRKSQLARLLGQSL